MEPNFASPINMGRSCFKCLATGIGSQPPEQSETELIWGCERNAVCLPGSVLYTLLTISMLRESYTFRFPQVRTLRMWLGSRGVILIWSSCLQSWTTPCVHPKHKGSRPGQWFIKFHYFNLFFGHTTAHGMSIPQPATRTHVCCILAKASMESQLLWTSRDVLIY